MPLQKYKLIDDGAISVKQALKVFNSIIDHCNALEARLSALEHPVERLSEETVCTCTTNTMSPCKKCNR